MASINFYLDVPYKVGTSSEEKEKIILKIKQCKAKGIPVPKALLSDKETSIYLILTLKKKLVNANAAKLIKLKTDYKVYPKNWDFNTKMPNANGTGNMELSIWLSEIKTSVSKKYNEIVDTQKEISPELIKKLIEPIVKKEDRLINSNDFFAVFDLYLKHKPKASPLTVKKYQTLKNILLEFQDMVFKNKLTFESINLEFKISFETFLIEKKKYVNNTIEKYTSELKYFLKWAFKEGKHKNNYFETLKATRDLVEIVHLEFDEFASIVSYKTENERLARIRDLFVFQCLTGQRWQDLNEIKWSDIQNGFWELYQQKGNKTVKIEIPLHQVAIDILQKYKGEETPLPRLSNQKYNDAIKDLCKELKFDQIVKVVRYSGSQKQETVLPKYQLISSHVARKTFINIAPYFGIPIEITMSITGHQNYETIQKHYRKISHKEKQTAIEKIKL